MLHFSLSTGGTNPITDDQGESGVPIFNGVLFDGTPGAGGSTQDIELFLFNDDNNFQYNDPSVTVVPGAVALASWFFMLDDQFVSGVSPTESEWATYGVPGTETLVLNDVSNSGGANPQRIMWLRAVVPDGAAPANLSDARLRVSAVQEAV